LTSLVGGRNKLAKEIVFAFITLFNLFHFKY
jgi:hypothetical protein